MFQSTRKSLAFRLIVSFVNVCFISSYMSPVRANAQTPADLGMPAAGEMISLSPAYVPVIARGLRVHPENPILFDFLLDTGNSGFALNDPKLKGESEKLIKYFLASLTIPDQEQWVNLSPYEKNRIINDQLGQTEMGRDMLAEDYILKQLTSSMIYPEKQLGKEFWNRVYTKAQQLYGTNEIPVNTFNKVWITADKADIYVHDNTAFVVASHLKVMLEEDYLSLAKHEGVGAIHESPVQGNDIHSVGSQIVREIVLPELEKEVNTGKNFYNLRQIFHSMVLAAWYKQNLKQAILNQVYANKAKINGVNLADPTIKEQIYKEYLKAYKKGVFNYIKEDIVNGQSVPHKYFSGGLDQLSKAMRVVDTKTAAAELDPHSVGSFAMATVGMENADVALSPAMKAGQEISVQRSLEQGNELHFQTADHQISFNVTKFGKIRHRVEGQLIDLGQVNVSKPVYEDNNCKVELREGEVFVKSKIDGLRYFDAAMKVEVNTENRLKTLNRDYSIDELKRIIAAILAALPEGFAKQPTADLALPENPSGYEPVISIFKTSESSVVPYEIPGNFLRFDQLKSTERFVIWLNRFQEFLEANQKDTHLLHDNGIKIIESQRVIIGEKNFPRDSFMADLFIIKQILSVEKNEYVVQNESSYFPRASIMQAAVLELGQDAVQYSEPNRSWTIPASQRQVFLEWLGTVEQQVQASPAMNAAPESATAASKGIIFTIPARNQPLTIRKAIEYVIETNANNAFEGNSADQFTYQVSWGSGGGLRGAARIDDIRLDYILKDLNVDFVRVNAIPNAAMSAPSGRSNSFLFTVPTNEQGTLLDAIQKVLQGNRPNKVNLDNYTFVLKWSMKDGSRVKVEGNSNDLKDQLNTLMSKYDNEIEGPIQVKATFNKVSAAMSISERDIHRIAVALDGVVEEAKIKELATNSSKASDFIKGLQRLGVRHNEQWISNRIGQYIPASAAMTALDYVGPETLKFNLSYQTGSMNVSAEDYPGAQFRVQGNPDEYNAQDGFTLETTSIYGGIRTVQVFPGNIIPGRLKSIEDDNRYKIISSPAMTVSENPAPVSREVEVQLGEAYRNGELKTSPLSTTDIRFPKAEGEVYDATEDSPENQELEQLGLQSIVNGEGVITVLAAGGSSRQNVKSAPAEVKAKLKPGVDLKSKAAVPVVFHGESGAVTYFDAFGQDVANLLQAASQEAKRAGVGDNTNANIFGFMSNDVYRGEHERMIEEAQQFGLKTPIRAFLQPLGAKYFATPADVEKLFGKESDVKGGAEALAKWREDRRVALEKAQEIERKYKAGDKEAIIIPDEKEAQGHGEFLHQLIATAEIVHYFDTGKKWVFTKNIDNVAAKFDRVFLRILGHFLKNEMDFQIENSPRAPGQKGGMAVVTPQGTVIGEDPNVKATVGADGKPVLNTDLATWMNNAVGLMSIHYILSFYKDSPEQSDADFIEELRNADAHKRQEIAQRGRQKFPKILDIKPSTTIPGAYGVKVETNSWMSSTVASANLKVGIVGVRGSGNFDIDAYVASKDDDYKLKERQNLRFSATKQWNVTPSTRAATKEKLEKARGHEVSDLVVGLASETYVDNEPLNGDLIQDIKTPRDFSGILNPAMASNKEVAPQTNAAMNGGIDLNASNMTMNINGEKISIKFDPAMMAQFQHGDFSGVRPVIINITPVASVLPILGFRQEDLQDVERVAKA